MPRMVPLKRPAANSPSGSKRQCQASPARPLSPIRRASATSGATGTGFGLYASALAGSSDMSPPPSLTPPRAATHDRQHLRSRAPRTEALAGELEHKFLPAFVARAAASLPQCAWQKIGKNVRRGGTITLRIGTACSGSEFYLTALPLIAEELSTRFACDFRFDHCWSCELDPHKRQWIMDNFSPKKLFADITSLADKCCHDFVSGASAEVDDVDILIAGTSCKDASRLNPHHISRLNVIAAGAHSTGGTFQGLARLVAKMGPRCRMVFLENVASLQDKDKETGRSNFDGVRDAVRGLGFGFVSSVFSALDMGLPVARPRLYMSGVRCSDEASAQQMADVVLASISRDVRLVPLDALLLRDGVAGLIMRDWMPEALSRPPEQPYTLEEVLWQGRHQTEWAQVPPRLVERLVPPYIANPWFRAMPRRQQDLLLLTVCRHEMARKQALAIPLHTSLGWEANRSTRHLPTIVPRGVFWLPARGRPLLGIEAVRLQGCDPCMLPGLAPERHDSAFLFDLAGNAFCVYQFCAWLFASMAAGDQAIEAGDHAMTI